MAFLELVSKRQSVRDYLEKPVEREKIERCLEAARLAPSACNSQPWKFIVVDDPNLKEAVARETFSSVISFNRFTLKAPAIIIIVSENRKLLPQIGGAIKDKPYHLIDVGIAAEHICLQAVEEGLGTCMVGWFNESPLKKLLGIPERKRIELLITIGYPSAEAIRKKNRIELPGIYSYNKYE
ncbi:NAD(P)H nitroreductase [Thermanaerosceptrum fracticalcis]|uniref:NAD(P)H nitroreductase n=1 Tax=Thermanaerosceptrum fracticalcis TaxID=1712410 RepID=A0A7G6E6Z1_THEFR|nr:nitroreductase family protein [Thermanaerosceptrum fracticalcis]QNB47845.1 NAD(P)H nitroreductase [Thermanaerosceptrum fracticalcis]